MELCDGSSLEFATELKTSWSLSDTTGIYLLNQAHACMCSCVGSVERPTGHGTYDCRSIQSGWCFRFLQTFVMFACICFWNVLDLIRGLSGAICSVLLQMLSEYRLASKTHHDASGWNTNIEKSCKWAPVSRRVCPVSHTHEFTWKKSQRDPWMGTVGNVSGKGQN